MNKASGRLLWLVLFVVVNAVMSEGAAASGNLSRLRRSVFKINVVSSDPNFMTPWKKDAPSSSNGTGFYIGKNRIVTNAHVIANATFITILRDGDSKPVPARVRFVAHDSDLALLEAADPKIFKDTVPLELGPVPRLRSPVSTIGFPTGGEQVSITQGVVSRLSYRRYVHHGSFSHLLVQVDSAINPGNSGGPVVQGRQVIGVAFQSFTRAENTGYIIPTPVVHRFLKDIEDGRYDGHPEDGLRTADWALLNASTAAFHGLKPEDGGVKVASVADWAPTFGHIQAGDIILAIDGQPLGVDGKIDFQGERVDFRALFDLKQMGDKALFKLVREGKRFDVAVDIKPSAPHHRPELVYAKHPKYFVWGGLVFTSLTRSLLRSWGERWYRDAPLLLRYLDLFSAREPTVSGKADLLVLIKRLPDEVNSYASENIFGVVSEVDGEPIESISELAERLERGTGEFAVVRFLGSNEPLVLSRAAVKERNGLINERYAVVPDRWFDGDEVDGALSFEEREAKPALPLTPALAPSPAPAAPMPQPSGFSPVETAPKNGEMEP